MRKDQNGFSMVGALLAAAAVAGIALVIAQLGDNSKKIQSSTKASLEVSNTVNNIEKLLLNTKHCSKTFENLNLGLGATAPIDEIGRDNSGVFEPVFRISLPPPNEVIIENTSLEIQSMNVIRDATNGNQMQLEVTIFKRNKAASARTITKRFNLEARFDGSNVLQKCFSQLDGAIVSACEALGGDIQDADCIDTRLECEMRQQFMKWKGVPGTQTICGETYRLERVTINETSTSPRNHSLPTTFVEGTFKANILGGGGGGGCGCADHGTGGKAGIERFLTKSQTDSLLPGSLIRYRRGKGGDGGNGSGCRWSRKNGQSGDTSYLQTPTITITAPAGSGGRARTNNHGHGYDSLFMSTVYPGAAYSSNRSGRPGSIGSGGAGGEKNAVDCRSGGRGGHGVVKIEYFTFRQL
jgi:hypothetical protein